MNLDKMLAFHCAPTLVGLKPANLIAHLKRRVIESGGFPHEVGVFLGYPLVDVLGFIKNKGPNCKFCGYWKVYGDAEEARCLFDAYSRVREEMFKRVEEGFKIAQIKRVA